MASVTDNKRVLKKTERDKLLTSFGACLRTLRKNAGMSQDELAGRADIDRAHLSELEHGKFSPSLDVIYCLLVPLGCSFVDFGRALDNAFKAKRNNHGGK